MTLANPDPITLLAHAGLLVHLCLAVAFGWQARRWRARWAPWY